MISACASGSSKDLDRKQKPKAKAKQIVSSLGTNSAKCRASVKPPANQSAWLWHESHWLGWL